MTDHVLADESSVENSAPREFYDIVQSELVTYRIASGVRSVDYLGNRYMPEPIARTDVGISSTTGEFEVSISLPLSHPYCQRYLAQSSPPRQTTIRIWRKQTSGIVERQWEGYVTSMSFSRHTAKFLIPSKMSRSFDRKVPSITAGGLCPHILYDSQCRVARDPIKVTTTVASHDGRRIVVTSVAPYVGDQTVFPFGELLHVASGERMTIFDQSDDTKIDLQAPIPGLADGDAIVLFPGCAKIIATCHDKFDNMANYGGFPQLPNTNLFLPGSGLGIYATERL